jgi:hypothetical protein
MDDINDEAAALAGVAASKSQSNGNDASIADPQPESKPARPLTETSLISARQAHRIVRAVARKFDAEFPTAWLLSAQEYAAGTVVVVDDFATPPLEARVGDGSWGTVWPEHAAGDPWSLTGTICLGHTVILLGTLLSAVSLAIMPKAKSRAEGLSWLDRFFELRDAILSLVA